MGEKLNSGKRKHFERRALGEFRNYDIVLFHPENGCPSPVIRKVVTVRGKSLEDAKKLLKRPICKNCNQTYREN